MLSIPKLVGRLLPRRGLFGLTLLASLIVVALSYVVAAAGTVRSVTYAGTTAQHAGPYGVQRLPTNQISFRLAGGAVRSFSIPWVASCTSAAGARTDALLERTLITDALPVRGGRFSASATYSFSPGSHQTAEVEQFSLAGRIRGRRASGTLSINALITQSIGGIATCQTNRPIRWSTVAGGVERSLTYPALQRPQQLGYIAYARADPTTGTSAIWLLNRTGGAAVQVTRPPPGASDTRPALSLPLPGGLTALAYERVVAGVSQIYVTGPFSNRSSISTKFPGGRITAFPAGAHEPAISGLAAINFGEIVFSVGSGADCSLWVVDGSGYPARAPRRLTDHGGSTGCDSAPTWSPDGKSIAFHRDLTDAAGVPISGMDMVVSARGGTPRALNFPSPATAFSWAPGNKLVFLSPAGPGPLPCLETVNPDGSGQKTILCAAGLTGRPVWAPSRDAIAFVERQSDGSTDIATVSTAGGAPIDATNTPGISEDAPALTFPPITGPTGGQPGSGVHARPQRPGR
ncbi:MAG: hypothetical protein M3071_03735 [Actinomycetota bacterium]|nr:hypothetical protein [Actinomycetota bacterium]